MSSLVRTSRWRVQVMPSNFNSVLDNWKKEKTACKNPLKHPQFDADYLPIKGKNNKLTFINTLSIIGRNLYHCRKFSPLREEEIAKLMNDDMEADEDKVLLLCE